MKLVAPHRLHTAVLATCLAVAVGTAAAQEVPPEVEALFTKDVAGAADNPLTGRYEESVLFAQTTKAFDEVILPSGPAEGETFRRDEQKFTATVKPQGRVTRSVYIASPGRSSLEVTANFVDALTANGFAPVFQCSSDDCGESFPLLKYRWDKPETQVRGENYEHLRGLVIGKLFDPVVDVRYTLMKKSAPEGDSYVGIYGAEHSGGSDTYTRALANRVGVLVEIVEPRVMERRMVVVEAEQIGNQLAVEGKAVFYGILFDFDKAEIKPDSEPQLAEMAKFLQADPSIRVFVLGHTDNKGTLDYNLDLSNRRAAAVVQALTSKYGIGAERMVPRGLGPMTPMATNRTEEGRAKNRRVELVER
ncbi:MAG: OmpA family protein [bacterium]